MIKKGIIVLSVLVLSFLFYVSYMKYLGISGFGNHRKMFIQNNFNSSMQLIGHGGGNLNIAKGSYKDVTNALEAFEQNYEQGLRTFEVDLIFTEENQVIARHDWQPYLYEKILGQKQESADGKPLKYETVMDKKIFSNYHTADLKQLFLFLKEHPDATLITDTKTFDSDNLQKMFREIISTGKSIDERLLNQMIPQIYYTDQYAELMTLYPFKNIIFTLYQTNESNEEIVGFLQSGKSLYGVAVTEAQYIWRKSLLATTKEQNVKYFVNTVDSIENLSIYQEAGVDGIYSNAIREIKNGWINNETNRYQLNE